MDWLTVDRWSKSEKPIQGSGATRYNPMANAISEVLTEFGLQSMTIWELHKASHGWTPGINRFVKTQPIRHKWINSIAAD